MTQIESGRILRGDNTGCVVGCAVNQLEAPAFGGMVRIPLGEGYDVYGLIHNIHIDDDGLVRQLVTAGNVSPDVVLDNRYNRNVPVEISVLFIGYVQGQRVVHLLPPRPPLTLDAMVVCTDAEIARFTSAGRLGYFRHILRSVELPLGEILAAHLQQVERAQAAAGNPQWLQSATQELITLLRDDYATLMQVLSAIADL
jgi:hypothetical protein